eukprot:TRINITY_DN570_c0_g1_i10.p1 TRINITY_DN570_c0_g1~~TRINITY_DN570_c0_g1_i10.p1  ORF type:complete len:693 (+),score=144.68 TRINITY_DN570_c0_g1_i10:26-2104(+)
MIIRVFISSISESLFHASMMKITLDLVDYAFTLKQLRRLYQELPQELCSQKTSLPASELILEATEYISYLKKKDALEERPLQVEVEDASYSHSVTTSPLRPSLGDKVIPDEIRDRFQVQHPLFYESLRTLKSSEELKVFAQLLRAPPFSLPKSPCFTLDSPHHSRAHLIAFNSTRSYSGDKLLSYCTSPSCINPHHYAELPSEVFIRNLSRRVLDKKNHEGYTSFLRALLKHLSSEEVSTISAGFVGDQKACFPVQARSFPSRGEMNYRHLKEFVQHLLFKTFRFHSVDGELSLISSAECLITNGNDREKILCLNPWHFKQATIPKGNQQIIPHICQPRLVVNISHSKFKCCICWTEILTSDKEESATLPTVQIQSTKVIVPVPSVIKPKDNTIAQQPEPQTPPQAQQQPQAKSQHQANSQPQAKSKSLAKSQPQAKPHSPALRERSTRKRKIQAIFQCWKCLLKFPTNSELESHPCSRRQRDGDVFGEDYGTPSVEVKSEQQVDEEECVPEKMPKENPPEEEDAALLSAIKEEVLDDYEAHFFDEKSPPASSSSENKWDDTVYTCMYCSFASLDPVVLRSHQGKCKELGPGPLPELASFVMTSEASGTKSSLNFVDTSVSPVEADRASGLSDSFNAEKDRKKIRCFECKGCTLYKQRLIKRISNCSRCKYCRNKHFKKQCKKFICSKGSTI